MTYPKVTLGEGGAGGDEVLEHEPLLRWPLERCSMMSTHRPAILETRSYFVLSSRAGSTSVPHPMLHALLKSLRVAR